MHRVFLTVLCGAYVSSAAAADFATEVMEATFKFFHPNSTATCFLIRRPAPDAGLFLVTAAHVVETTKGGTAVLVLRNRRDDGAYERRDQTIAIRRDNKPLWTRHAKQDVAVLRLAENLPVPVGALPESALADEARLRAVGVHICSPLFVLSYPTRFEANGAGFPVARQGIFAGPPLLPVGGHPTFLADFTTFAGDSGGPVFIADANNRPLVVGLVVAQYNHDEKSKMAFEERSVRHPLGLGKVLHAQYIRETLEQAVRPPRHRSEESDRPITSG